MRHAAARDRYDSQKEAEAAEALQAAERRGYWMNSLRNARRSNSDAGERLAAERSSLMSQHGAALAALAAERARSEELLANQSDADVTVLRNEYALQTDRTAAAHACALAEARLLYGDDLAELQGQLEDAQQALRDAPEPVDNQDELLALEAEASAQVRGMSLSMAVVFFSNALEARSRRLLARAFAVLKAAAASASAVALRDIDHADALREVVLESNKAAARVTGSSDLARVLWTFMRRRHVGAWNQWRRVALYQRFCNERDILLEAARVRTFFPEGRVRSGAGSQADAAQLELEDAVARALSEGERASLEGARRPRGPRRIYVRGARAGAPSVSWPPIWTLWTPNIKETLKRPSRRRSERLKAQRAARRASPRGNAPRHPEERTVAVRGRREGGFSG